MNESRQKKFFLDTYGCAANKSDAERIRRILHDNSYLQSSNVDEADIVIFNTIRVNSLSISRESIRFKIRIIININW